ncbi:polyribonucleotide nucleotidyltransferase, partial [bacterium]|nr:polyribonucleotide nucleotidyltransferase [bacterium]
MHQRTFSLEVGGKTLIAEFNDLAEQANGSVMMRYGNTVVLATAVMSAEARQGDGHNGKSGHGEDGGFLPLTVEYEERFYASGKILGSRFMRREGRPSDEAILSGRIVDRTIRPLFNQKIRNEIQVVLTVMSIDEDDPDVVSVIAASLALGVSDIPWDGPVSAVRVTKNEVFHINPNYATREEAGVSLELVACGKEGLVNMIEVGSKEVSEA